MNRIKKSLIFSSLILLLTLDVLAYPVFPLAFNENSSNSYICFTYQHSTKTVEIHGTNAIPEFLPWIILPSFFIPTLFAIVFKKKVNRPFVRNVKSSSEGVVLKLCIPGSYLWFIS